MVILFAFHCKFAHLPRQPLNLQFSFYFVCVFKHFLLLFQPMRSFGCFFCAVLVCVSCSRTNAHHVRPKTATVIDEHNRYFFLQHFAYFYRECHVLVLFPFKDIVFHSKITRVVHVLTINRFKIMSHFITYCVCPRRLHTAIFFRLPFFECLATFAYYANHYKIYCSCIEIVLCHFGACIKTIVSKFHQKLCNFRQFELNAVANITSSSPCVVCMRNANCHPHEVIISCIFIMRKHHRIIRGKGKKYRIDAIIWGNCNLIEIH